jgi:PAS domain S-box-containing protein
MATLVRRYDWSRTVLGKFESWQQSLRTAVELTLSCQFPMIVLWGSDLIQVYNDAYREVMGSKHPAGLGQATFDCWPEVWKINEPIYAKVFQGETLTFTDQLYPITRHGYLEDAYFTLCYSPLHDDEGAIRGVLVTVFETTEQKRATEALKANEARLTDLFQQIPAFVTVLRGPEHVFEMTNPLYRELVGFRDVLGKSVATALPEAVEQGYTALLDKVYKTGEVYRAHGARFTLTRAMEQGSEDLYLDLVYQPLREADNSISGIIVVGIDVTEARQNALDLATSEADLHWTLQLNPHNPWTANAEGLQIDFSARWLALTGLTEEQVRGQGWMQVPHPDDLTLVQTSWAASIASGEPYDVEHRVRLASGGYIWMRSRALPRRSPEGQVVRWYGSIEDIHDRKMGERALLQSEKLAAVGRLASSIAHEINNPLEAVTNLLYLARGTENNEAQIMVYIAAAEAELQRVSQITNQTLRFHKQSTSQQAVHCGDLIQQILTLYKGRLLNANIQVDERMQASRPIVCFDGEIRQVLSNLLGNAIDASRGEGARLLIRSREGTDWKTGRKGLMLTVADNGMGMSIETKKRVFEPFFTTKGAGGVGLGLWVSCEIIARHKGRLSVRSTQRPGRAGTAFALFLPF